jgi:hypothetical protein
MVNMQSMRAHDVYATVFISSQVGISGAAWSIGRDTYMIPIDRALRFDPSTLRAFGVCFAIVSFACTHALACSGPSFERTIIFNHVPTDVDTTVIVEVTIIDMTPDLRDRYTFTGSMAVMNARVENVIKGQIGQGTLKIVTPLGDCSNGFGVGSHGFVAGELRSDANGNSELVAISENIRKANAH